MSPTFLSFGGIFLFEVFSFHCRLIFAERVSYGGGGCEGAGCSGDNSFKRLQEIFPVNDSIAFNDCTEILCWNEICLFVHFPPYEHTWIKYTHSLPLRLSSKSLLSLWHYDYSISRSWSSSCITIIKMTKITITLIVVIFLLRMAWWVVIYHQNDHDRHKN